MQSSMDKKNHICLLLFFSDELLILMPRSSALRDLIPSNLNPSVPDPLSADPTLQRHILTHHIVARGGSVPQKILNDLPEYFEVVKVSLAGTQVVIHREEGSDGESEYTYECI